MCQNLFYSCGIHLFLKYFTVRNLKWQLEISNVSNLNYTVTIDTMYARDSGENAPEKKHQKIEFYQSKFPTRDHPKKGSSKEVPIFFTNQ